MKSALLARIVVIITILVASVAFVATNVLAVNSDNTRPGWGNGDKNHEHTGPPGQSVNPSDSPKPTKEPKETKEPKPTKEPKETKEPKPTKTP
jgi:hypothetical protein